MVVHPDVFFSRHALRAGILTENRVSTYLVPKVHDRKDGMCLAQVHITLWPLSQQVFLIGSLMYVCAPFYVNNSRLRLTKCCTFGTLTLPGSTYSHAASGKLVSKECMKLVRNCQAESKTPLARPPPVATISGGCPGESPSESTRPIKHSCSHR